MYYHLSISINAIISVEGVDRYVCKASIIFRYLDKINCNSHVLVVSLFVEDDLHKLACRSFFLILAPQQSSMERF